MANLEQSRFSQQLSLSRYAAELGLNNLSSTEQSLIRYGSAGGSYATMRRMDDGDIDGIAAMRPGRDRQSDVDEANTVANERGMVRRRSGNAHPEELYIVNEVAPRLSRGNVSLDSLSRLALAGSLITADQSEASLAASFCSTSHPSARLGAYGEEVDSRRIFSMFDRYSKTARNYGQESRGGLARELRFIADGQTTFNDESGSVVVISDFIEGAILDPNSKNEEPKVIGFNWERPLRNLHQELGNKLKIFQRFSPSFINMPYVNRYRGPGGLVELERGEHRQLAKTAGALGREKQRYISKVLFSMNSVLLQTTDTDQVLVKNVRELLLG